MSREGADLKGALDPHVEQDARIEELRIAAAGFDAVLMTQRGLASPARDVLRETSSDDGAEHDAGRVLGDGLAEPVASHRGGCDTPTRRESWSPVVTVHRDTCEVDLAVVWEAQFREPDGEAAIGGRRL